MLFNLTNLSAEPIHNQMAQQLLEKILLDNSYDNKELPAIRKLAREQQISANAVEMAYRLLVNDGLIISKDDSRFFVPAFTAEQKRVFRKRLHVERSSVDLAAVTRELNMVHQLQTHLLPKSLPKDAGYSLSAYYEPSKAVSGDFYDCFVIDEAHFGLVIADACGNGLPAAMLVCQIQAMLKSEVGSGNSIQQVLANMNSQLVQFTPKNKFVTLFYGIFDKRNHTLEYAAAGHNYPVIVESNAGCRYLHVSGPGLGIVRNAVYETAQVRLQPGDLLFLYTDGITETMNTRHEEYGENRLLNILVHKRWQQPKAIIDAVAANLVKFSGSSIANDDRTMLVLKVKA